MSFYMKILNYYLLSCWDQILSDWDKDKVKTFEIKINLSSTFKHCTIPPHHTKTLKHICTNTLLIHEIMSHVYPIQLLLKILPTYGTECDHDTQDTCVCACSIFIYLSCYFLLALFIRQLMSYNLRSTILVSN